MRNNIILHVINEEGCKEVYNRIGTVAFRGGRQFEILEKVIFRPLTPSDGVQVYELLCDDKGQKLVSVTDYELNLKIMELLSTKNQSAISRNAVN